MDDYSLENLLRMARILDAAAAIDEEPIALGAGATEPDGWRLSVEAPSIPPLEVRCGDRERGRRLLWTSVIELLTDRGLLGTQLWPAEFFSEEDEPPRVDPEYQKYRDAREQDAATLAALTSVLEHDESEETVQKFIEQRPHLWRFVSASPPFVLPKFAIGSKYVTDFTILGVRHWSQSQMRTATFVELERPSHRLFNRRGDPSAELVHGLRQVHDWQQWITDNRNYVRDMFVERGWMDWERSMLEGGEVPPHGFADRYLLVIGRRASLTAEDRLRLHRLNENSPDVQIITYDVMVNCLMPEAPFIPWQVMVFGSD